MEEKHKLITEGRFTDLIEKNVRKYDEFSGKVFG